MPNIRPFRDYEDLAEAFGIIKNQNMNEELSNITEQESENTDFSNIPAGPVVITSEPPKKIKKKKEVEVVTLTNWSELIEPQYFVVNEKYFKDKNLPVPSSAEGLSDREKLVTLMGYRKLAFLRGFSSVKYFPIGYSSEETVVSCEITWAPHEQTNNLPITYSAIGNASVYNTDPFFSKFLGAMAENRAFVRCVRSFLNIPIYGQDEMAPVEKGKNGNDNSPPVSSPSNLSPTDPRAILTQRLADKGKTFAQLKNGLLKTNKYTVEVLNTWNSETDVPLSEAVTILQFIK
jgi:hypothetical protein